MVKSIALIIINLKYTRIQKRREVGSASAKSVAYKEEGSIEPKTKKEEGS